MFWRHSCDVSTLVQNNSEFFVCLSVRYLAHFLPEITQILGYLQIWIRYLSEIFWRHSWDVCTLVSNNSEFLYVCQSVCWLTLLLKFDKYRDISSSVRAIFLKFSGHIPGMFLHLFQIILNFLYVCQSVSWLRSLLKLHK